MTTPFGQEHDIFLMNQALGQACKASANDEVPVGALVVSPEGKVIARAYNCTERRATQAAHAEVLAIAQAGRKLGDWRMDNHWLYVTLEPCSMCMGLIRLSRFAGVAYGAPSPLFGYHLDNNETVSLYKKDAIIVVPNICGQEAARLLKTFFQAKRKKSG